MKSFNPIQSLKLSNYILVNGELTHISRLKKEQATQNCKPKINEQIHNNENKTVTKPKHWTNPEVPIEIKKSVAKLVIAGKAIKSTNRTQAQHWSQHCHERKRAKELIKTATWVIPFGKTIPITNSEKRRRIIMIWYGKKQMDKINFANGAKKILDELVYLGYFVDDAPKWIDDNYYTEKTKTGEKERLELLFFD